MDLAGAFYAAVAEVRDGGVNEIEVSQQTHDEQAGVSTIVRVTVRRWSAAEAYAILGTDCDDDDEDDPS